jgi:hypothetical protein
VPLELAFTCLLAAIAGALVAAPVRHGPDGRVLDPGWALQTAPILIAVVTAFLTMEAVKYLLGRRKHAGAAAAKPAAGAKLAAPD